MDIPSWAFVSVGKSLVCFSPKSKPKPKPLIVINLETNNPVYEELLEVINDMMPKDNYLLNLCIELYT